MYYFINYDPNRNSIPSSSNIPYRMKQKYSIPDQVDPLTAYINEQCIGYQKEFDLILYWKRCPHQELKRMALDIISIPATSANVERLFSSSKLVDCFNRQRMLPQTKRLLVLTKNWWRYLLNNKNK